MIFLFIFLIQKVDEMIFSDIIVRKKERCLGDFCTLQIY